VHRIVILLALGLVFLLAAAVTAPAQAFTEATALQALRGQVPPWDDDVKITWDAMEVYWGVDVYQSEWHYYSRVSCADYRVTRVYHYVDRYGNAGTAEFWFRAWSDSGCTQFPEHDGRM
jgi:hypothetical protein